MMDILCVRKPALNAEGEHDKKYQEKNYVRGRRGRIRPARGGAFVLHCVDFCLKICDYYIKGEEGRASPEDLEFIK